MDIFKPYGAVPSQRQLAHYHFEKKAFFHFGINTFTDLEWGEGNENIALFNPVGCDCGAWIRDIKRAGFKLAIITAKHHDGFCLWQSDVTDHCMKKSPYMDGKGDIIREFTDACREYGIRAGVYISPWDRNSPYWGSDEYSSIYNAQLTELLSGYGRIDEVWWDGAGSTETVYDWNMWADTVRRLQPEAVIFGSLGATPYVEMRWVGNEGGFAGNPCFATIDAHALAVEDTALLNSGMPDGERFIIAEVDTSTRPGWFYHDDQQKDVKDVGALTELWFDSVGSNALMLLNFPPDRTGNLPKTDIENAIKAHDVIEKARSINLASDADITSNSAAYFDVKNMFASDESVFAPKGNTVTLTFKFKQKISFNMFEIGEAIEYGHRIRGFRIKVSDRVIFDGKCVGYKWAEHFERTETDTVTLEIYDAKDNPLIRHFALYSIDESVFMLKERVKNGKNIVKKITYTDFTAEVEFGGIYPFNTLSFNGTGLNRYSIDVFDGAQYRTVYNSRSPHKNQVVTFDKTYTDSYKLRFNSQKKKIDPQTIDIRVFEI